MVDGSMVMGIISVFNIMVQFMGILIGKKLNLAGDWIQNDLVVYVEYEELIDVKFSSFMEFSGIYKDI